MKPAIIVTTILLLVVILFFAFRRRPPAIAEASPQLVEELRGDVAALCAKVPRNTFIPENLSAAANYIDRELTAAGYRVERQRYRVEQDGTDADNLIVEIPGETNEIVIIGAHYDTCFESPGADDNASGTAAVLALARRFVHEKPKRTLRFVAFANEEPPHFQTRDMGSIRYAQRCKERGEKIVAMISIESIGYYSNAPGSQKYPTPLDALYPSTGNFVGFVGNVSSGSLVMKSARAFRKTTSFPAEAAILPQMIQEVGWSDQWAFWQFGWPAIMVSDTAPFRNPHYHQTTDLPETLDYARFATVVEGLVGVVRALAAY